MEINIIGMGMGTHTVTSEAKQALEKSQIIIGAKRFLEDIAYMDIKSYSCGIPEQMAEIVMQNTNYSVIGIIVSGDVGFYSAAKKLIALLKDYTINLYCGISCPQAFAAKLKRPWQNFRLISAHGQQSNIIGEVMNHSEVFMLTDKINSPNKICEILCAFELNDVKITVGENLYSSNEKITTGTAEEILNGKYDPLCVMLIENKKTFARDYVSHGIDDSEFIREKNSKQKIIPMTKMEIRSVALSMLKIKKDDILWDIGAGTGSVSVEMALLARYGQVYAVEQNQSAFELANKNKLKFGAYNLLINHGKAPDALKDLPIPNGVFIGGTCGEVDQIFKIVLDKNPKSRIVVTCITLETLNQITKLMDSMNVEQVEIIQLGSTRLEQKGKYHMFIAQNPIFIISAKGIGK